MTVATFRFYEELNDFLPPARRKVEFAYDCAREATVKNAIEALGVICGGQSRVRLSAEQRPACGMRPLRRTLAREEASAEPVRACQVGSPRAGPLLHLSARPGEDGDATPEQIIGTPRWR
jgi:hypothetical protein